MTYKPSTLETFTYELLTADDLVIGVLDGVDPGGVLEESVNADIRSSASLPVRLTRDIDWLTHRVRISYTLDGTTRQLLTGIPNLRRNGRQLDLYDKTSIPHDDSFGQPYIVPAGANLIGQAIAVLASTGETTIAIPPSAATATTDLVWSTTATKLRIVNDLLTAAGYLTLECDGLGWYRAEPWTTPAVRPRRFRFAGRDGDPYLPEVDRQYDPFSVPNRVRVAGKIDGTGQAPIAEATDERPDNPWSKLRRGFWRTAAEEDVDAVDLAAYAARRLTELQQVYEARDVRHRWIPAGLNDAGTYYDHLAVIQKRVHRLSVGGLVTSTIRTVIG